jgi:serine/threonine protein phosphatase PrpC
MKGSWAWVQLWLRLCYSEEKLLSPISDSRAYLLREQTLTQITRDHTWGAEQLIVNSASEEEVLGSPFRNLVTRSMGFGSDIVADIFEVDLERDDYILLCTDGLYNLVSAEKILRTFKRHKTPEKICFRLIKSACQKGGKDNITAVVAYIEKTLQANRKKTSAKDTVKLDSIDEHLKEKNRSE